MIEKESGYEHKNIFLDFLGPDMWKTFPTLSKNDWRKYKILCQSLNVAVLLTDEYCILPPAFIAQSRIVRYVMMEKSSFLSNKLVLFPLRESNLEYYFEKKQLEYKYVKESHQEFYKEAGHTFIRKHNDAIIHRKATMGMSIAEQWKELSDDSELWRPIVTNIPQKADTLRGIPSKLKDRGLSITLEAVKKVAKIEDNSFNLIINQAIQHEYLKTYMHEYNAITLMNIPPKPIFFNFLIHIENIYYDYLVFEDILCIFGIDTFIKNVSADVIVELRNSLEWNKFMELFWDACVCLRSRVVIKRYFLEIKHRLSYYKKKVPHIFWSIEGKIGWILELCSEILEKSEIVNIEEIGLYNGSKEKGIRKGKDIMKDRVFVVHGHDEVLREKIENFCRKIGLEPIVLAENASCGMTIIEKIEHYSDVAFAIVIYAACDEGRLKGEKDFKSRARQNVVFEHGYMVAKLGREKVISLVDSDVEIPGDLSGVVYISLDSNWQKRVMKELHAAGLDIEWYNA